MIQLRDNAAVRKLTKTQTAYRTVSFIPAASLGIWRDAAKLLLNQARKYFATLVANPS
jgi:hypothetical protein